MAKLGKWSTGLSGSAKNAPSPYGMSNGGYDKRSNMSAAFDKPVDPRGVATKGYVGAAKDPQLQRKRAM